MCGLTLARGSDIFAGDAPRVHSQGRQLALLETTLGTLKSAAEAGWGLAQAFLLEHGEHFVAEGR
jgi:hypothetical protein